MLHKTWKSAIKKFVIKQILFVAALSASLWAKASCEHPYLAVKEGRTWSYHSSKTKQNYTLRTHNLSRGWFNISQRPTNMDGGWDCDSNGVGQFFHHLAHNFLQDLPLGFTDISYGGQGLPGVTQMKLGTSWDFRIILEGSGGKLLDVSVNNRIVSEDDVTVAAGKFRAFRVEQTLEVSGRMAPSVRDRKMTLWYAKGAGVVLLQGAGYEVQLLGVSR